MFSTTKFQQYPPIEILYQNPLYSTLFCKDHGHYFQYKCLFSSCNHYLCGKIQCIDNHFHDNQLSIQKLNMGSIITKFQRFEQLSKLPPLLMPVISQFKQIVDCLKEANSQIFSELKRYKLIADYITRQQDSELNEQFIKQMNILLSIEQHLEHSVLNVSKKINWSNIWINIEDEFQLVQKLRTDLFEEFKDLYLEKFTFSSNEQLRKRQCLLEQKQETNQGLIIIYFTEQNYVIGEFIANNNVETSSLFLNCFIFVVDLQGQIFKTSSKSDLIEINEQSNQNGSNNVLKIILKNCLKNKLTPLFNITQLTVKRISSFFCHL